MDIESLTPEQMERARACKTSEELVELARSEGVDLTEDQLDAISGGTTAWDKIFGCSDKCPDHGAKLDLTGTDGPCEIY